MELAILLVSGHLAACVARERDQLTPSRCELVLARWPKRVLRVIHDGKEPVAVRDFNRMSRRIGVSTNVVRQCWGGTLLGIEPPSQRNQHCCEHHETTARPVATSDSQHEASSDCLGEAESG